MSLPIKLRSIVSIPGRILGSDFITAVKSNRIWTIGVDFSVLGVLPLNDLSQVETVVRNVGTGEYGRVPLTMLVASASLPTDVAGDHTVAANETYLRCSLSAPATITLGEAVARAGLDLTIKDSAGNFATNNVTIDFHGAETADGLSSITLDQNYQVLRLVPKPGGWDIVHFG